MGTYENIQWPPFLRKVRWLRLEVVDFQGRRLLHAHPPMLPYFATSGPICSIIYSLCTFLRRGNSLKSLEINIRRLEILSQINGFVHQFRDSIPMTLYPLQFLPKIKRIHIEGVTADIERILTPSPAIIDVANKIAAGDSQALTQYTRLAETTCSQIRGDTGVFGMLPVRKKKGLPARLPVDDVFNFRGLVQMFVTAMEAIREEWHEHDPKRPSKQCKEQVSELVHLEVELRILLYETIAAMFD